MTLADLDTPFATLGRARVRRLKKHLADLVGPLRLRDEVPLFDDLAHLPATGSLPGSQQPGKKTRSAVAGICAHASIS